MDQDPEVLDLMSEPGLKLQRADVQLLSISKEEDPPEQQDWSHRLDQEDCPEHPHIKEEQEEVWTSQEEAWTSLEGEQLPGLEEADITNFTAVPVKREEDEEEEKPQSSQLHHRLTEQMKTEADGGDCGGPEPDRNSGPDPGLQAETDEQTEDSSEQETDDSEKDWKDLSRHSFCCSVCGKTFKLKGNLNIHMRTHTGEKPFSCSLCSKRFTQKAGLDYHWKTHTGERPFCCSVCGKTFRHKGALTYHMAIHTGVKQFSCTDCGKRFRGISQLRIHKCVGEPSPPRRGQSEKRSKLLSCSECDATFPNNYLFVTHVRMHKGKKLFTCTVCGQKRQFRSHLEIHMRTHTGEKPYSCTVCGKRFSQRGIMTQHMAIHSGVKPFGCSDCGKRFFWQFQIKKHKCLSRSSQNRRAIFNLKDPTGPEPARNLYADRCLKPDNDSRTSPSHESDDFWKEIRQHQSGFTYHRNKKGSVTNRFNTDKKTLTKIDEDMSVDSGQHRSGINSWKNADVSVSGRATDGERNPFASSECQKDSHTLQTNRKYFTAGKPFSCLLCGKEFATGGYLTRHICVHTGEKLLSCIVCEKNFTLESELINHECVAEPSQSHQRQTEKQITASKSFLCSQCGKGFPRKHKLQVHMRIHAGDKLFTCSVCSKTFSRRESLSFHMTCHTAEKPFSCSVCSASFSDSESLVKHMRIHTRQTQFSCSVCGKEFAWRRYLTKHMAVHAKERIYSCSACDRRFTRIYQLSYHHCTGRQTSQLHQSHTEENTEQMESDSGEENCGGSEKARNSDPDLHLRADNDEKLSDSSEGGTEDSVEDWEDTRDPQFSPNSQSDTTYKTGKKVTSCSDCEETFHYEHPLKVHMGNHAAEKHVSSTGEDQSHSHIGVHPEDQRGAEPEPPLIKEEQEEVCISPAGIKFTAVPVKSEEDDEEEKPQSSKLHQRLTEQMETEADGEDCGGPEPDRNSGPDLHFRPDSEDKTLISLKTDDSVDSDFWKETRKQTSSLNSLKNEVSESVLGCDSGERALSSSDFKSLDPESDDSVDSDFWKDNRKPHLDLDLDLDLNAPETTENTEGEMRYDARQRPYSCSECGKRFPHIWNMKNHMRFHTGERAVFSCSVCGQKCLYKSHLTIHMRTHTGEKPFVCPVCGKKYAHKASMQSHMVVHTVEKNYACNVCDQSFAWYTELKYHQCVGETSRQTPYWRQTL